ncbi:MAG: peptide chain release factor N(5)-glutamine methyltransferase [Flavobacterium sp.]|nr:peptide chain release factor N(5)-glutamine methyltransferase [Flavobacterium sp.]
MQLTTYRTQFVNSLSAVVDEAEAQSFFYLVVEQFHQLKRIDLALEPTFTITEAQWQQWESIRLRLLNQEPIQYILGSTSFYGLPFIVNPAVLIPRPETEELVEWVLKSFALNRQPTTDNRQQLLDIGTGSGCIAISLAKNLPDVHVSALDVSAKALEIAQLNAQQNGVQINFICQNILETTKLDQQFEVIVSNPPYVREIEKHEIQANVLEHEPHLALFVTDEDPLLFYRKIGELAIDSLTPSGSLFVEINQYLGEATVQLFLQIGFTQVELKKDLYGNDRMIRASR